MISNIGKSVRSLLLLSCLSLLCACGGGGESGGESGSSGSNANNSNSNNSSDNSSGDSTGNSSGTDNQQSFADINVQNEFSWQMQTQNSMNLQLTSNVSQNRTQAGMDWTPISGRHLIKVYGIDSDNNVITEAVFTGMTDQYGQLPLTFSIPAYWLGVAVHVELDSQTCTQTLSMAELNDSIQIGCDLVVTSDL